MRSKCGSSDEDVMSESEIVKTALGQKPGYVKGMGHGLIATRKLTRKSDRFDIEEKLAELDTANDQIAMLAKSNEEQAKEMRQMRLHMQNLEKLMKKIPGVATLNGTWSFVNVFCAQLSIQYSLQSSK